MEPDLDKLPEAFAEAYAVNGSWLFGRLVREPVNRFECVYWWEGGPLALNTTAAFDKIAAVHDFMGLLDGHPEPIRLYKDHTGQSVVIWARIEHTARGPRIVGWPEDQRPPKGYV